MQLDATTKKMNEATKGQPFSAIDNHPANSPEDTMHHPGIPQYVKCQFLARGVVSNNKMKCGDVHQYR